MKNCRISAKASIFIAAVLCLITVYSCQPARNIVDSKDLSYLYNPTKSPLNPRYNVLNESDTRSLFLIKFFESELFFSQANSEGVPKAQVLITVKLFNLSQGKTLADTAVKDLEIVKQAGKLEYIYEIPLKVEKGNDYLAEVRILDRLKLQVAQSFYTFNTTSLFNRFNFSTRAHFGKEQLFDPVIRLNEYINLVYTRGQADSLFVTYYKPFTAIPDPPSLLLPEKTLDYPPEKVAAIPYSDTLPIMFPREGIYFCSLSRNIKEGFTYFNFGEEFPKMTTPETMINPLGYLASPDEIASMKAATRPKAALDEFWIKCGGNVEKARELIRIYYTRVFLANTYFSSYKEGWRTERGMIYIIYGPPDKVYKSTDGESWGYKKPTINSSWGGRFTVSDDYLFFNFRIRRSAFTDNDFYLSRSETLITYWDKAVSGWRKGIVFRLDNPEDF